MKWWLLISTVLFPHVRMGKNLMWFTNLFLDYVRVTINSITVTTTDRAIAFSHRCVGNYQLILCGTSVYFILYTPSNTVGVSASVKGQNISQDVLDGFFQQPQWSEKIWMVVSDAVRVYVSTPCRSLLVSRYRYSRKIYLCTDWWCSRWSLIWRRSVEVSADGRFCEEVGECGSFRCHRRIRIIKQDALRRSYRCWTSRRMFSMMRKHIVLSSIDRWLSWRQNWNVTKNWLIWWLEFSSFEGGMRFSLLRSQPALNQLTGNTLSDRMQLIAESGERCRQCMVCTKPEGSSECWFWNPCASSILQRQQWLMYTSKIG